MKNNKGLVIITIILGVLVVLMGGYIVYDKVLNQNNNSESKENKESKNSVSKLNNSKDWVYDADYDLPTNKESYYGFSDHSKLISASDLVVPYINIDSDDAKKANKEIYELYENLIKKFNENLKDEIWFTLVEYKTYTNDNIISVVITTESSGTGPTTYDYYTYNFNLNNGKLLSYKEAYNITGFTESNIEDKVIRVITDALMEIYLGSTEEKYSDFYTDNNKNSNNYKTSVDNDTIRFFIDENKKLNIIVTLETTIAGYKTSTILTVK